ncbi:hypothetical protein GYMLUDRAFT_88906 [Collybiopsis luxurians FD-317 M1]|uniref:Kinesin motor domain-containing protein n=1 Tax=Collybiopsis luxurians FD-317 M1 TaxID=944289 RepID=A0A0D0CAJ8_9AGAR|nr:hypothetical protein GYMLUDRAFT_88906 [Collybiopsis luxurians FD-317 M1]
MLPVAIEMDKDDVRRMGKTRTTMRMKMIACRTNPSSRFRSSTVTPFSTYTFSHIFALNATQADFFTKTTLPLVRDVLEGQNTLLFTYGVTNSGKTYTIQGGSNLSNAYTAVASTVL